METKDKTEFAALMALVADVYDHQLHKATVGTYWSILERYPMERVKKGVQRLLETYKGIKFPVPAVFVENIVGDLQVQAIDAWQEYRRLIRVYGVYSNPVCENPILAHTIKRLGGWVEVNNLEASMNDRELGFFQRDFINLYRALAAEPDLGKPPRLIGLHEEQNVALGFQQPGTSLVRTRRGTMIDVGSDAPKQIGDNAVPDAVKR